LVGGADDLRGSRVGSLHHDHVGEFLTDIDCRGFKCALDSLSCWSVVGPIMFLILDKMGVWAALNGGMGSLGGQNTLDTFDAIMFGAVTLISLVLIPKISTNLTGAAIESFTGSIDTAKKAGMVAAGGIG